jgi:DNA-binding transcriptional ArsR family regulator
MDEAQRLARIFKALSVDTRARIVMLLRERTLCVNAIAGHLGISAAAVSQHLRVLRDAGLVVAEKRGYYVHYRLDPKMLTKWRKAIDRLLEVEEHSSRNTGTGCPRTAMRKERTT